MQQEQQATHRDPLVIQKIRMRFEHNKNALIFILGQTGEGKSYSAMRLAEVLDPNFNSSRIVFSATDFLKLITTVRLPKGSVILWDESGVALNSRKWQSKDNKATAAVLQTFRNLNLCLIFTCPSFKFFDSVGRELVHYVFKSVGINHRKSQVVLKPFILESSLHTNKQYIKYPRTSVFGHIVATKYLRVGLPSPSLVKEYEVMKNKYTHELNLQKLDEMTGVKVKPVKTVRQTPEEIAQKVLENPQKFFKSYGGKQTISWPMIKTVFRTSQNRAREAKDIADSHLKLGAYT